MLLTMRALTRAARAICYATAVALDRAEGADERGRAEASERAALLTPVAKAFATDIGCEVASLGVQVHGGMGYVEETGAAQHLRDARIAPIYEGTNGIQAIDLVTRKLPLSGGAAVRSFMAELRRSAAAVAEANEPAFGATGQKLPMRSMPSNARPTGCSPVSATIPTPPWLARRPICGCSRPRRAVPYWPRRRLQPYALPPMRRRAWPSPVSLRRTSRFRRLAWNSR